jgi:polysaccharide export outer membrane protein
MKKIYLFLIICTLLISCSHKKQILYISDTGLNNLSKTNYSFDNNIQIGDILKIDVHTIIPEASIPYSNLDLNTNQSADILAINGYLVDKNSMVHYPVLGKISVIGYSELAFANKIKELLVDGGHLTNPHVKVKKVNSKFTILGEVRNPGTFSFFDNKLNIFQALGVAGDLLITAKRKNITLLREENGLRKTYKFSLTSTDLLDKPFYYIRSNDVIIVEPNFSKIKSAGFIGSPSSIASISSLILSITLLLINN